MKIEELRVGNLVKDIKGQIREIKGIDSYNEPTLWLKIPTCSLATGMHSINDVCPIKITEEILLKCGFEAESKYSDFNLNGVNIQSCSLICKTLERRGFFLNLGDENEKLNIRIDYLHELQNLYYALIKEELEIKQ